MALLLLQGCSTSWKQKDFQKEVEKDKEVEPSVQVDEGLREKFEVKSVEEKTPHTKAEGRPVVKVKTPKKIAPKKEKEKVAAPEEVKGTEAPKEVKPKGPPADYPEEMKALNEKARAVWEQYRSNHYVDEKVFLDIHYLGMTVGKIMFTNKGKRMINNKEVWHFHARFKSAPFYSNIYELDDIIDTYVTTDKFLSIRYSLVQRESKQDVDDLQLHDRDQFKTFWFYKKKKSDGTLKEKQKEGYIPFFSIDPFSVLFLYQGLPLKNNDTFDIPVINKGKILVLKSVIEGREVIETKLGRKKAIRIHATTKYTGDHLKSGDLYLWISDDDRRILLRARAKIKIGSVTADIVDG